MQLFLRIIFFLFLVSLSSGTLAQENKTKASEETLSQRAKRKKAKTEWKKQRKAEKTRKKEVKEYHKAIQTKKVRKRMKRDKRRANLNNEHKRELFLVRWFTKNK